MPTRILKRRWLTFSLRTFLVATLGVALVLGYIGRSRLAAERERQMRELIAQSFSNSAWVERPKLIGKPTAQDEAARKALLEVVEQKQDPEFRRDYRIIVPEHGTGLPRDYDVLIYGKYIDLWPSRLEVRVRDGKAQGELLTDEEFRRGEVAIDVVDNLVRQLAYGYVAADERRKPREFDSPPMWSTYVSHAPCYCIEVISRTDKLPWHLKTDDWPLVADGVRSNTAGVQGTAHTRFGIELIELLHERLPVLQSDAALKKELVQRLAAISPPAGGGREDDSIDADPATLPLDYYLRYDLPAVEALVYSQLAVRWRIAQAAPEFQRLFLHEAQAELAIATADDPTELLRTALTGENGDLFGFAVDFLVEDVTPEVADLVVQAWPDISDDFRREQIVSALKIKTVSLREQTEGRESLEYDDLIKRLQASTDDGE
jgi:hypothetical protein